MKKHIIGLILISSLFVSCETAIDSVEPGPSIPIVYVILNCDADTNFIRINKSFIGNMSAYDMALYPDSILYTQDLDVKVNILNNNGNLVKRLSFEKQAYHKDSVNSNGEVIFATDQHHVYITTEKIPDDLPYKCQLEISVNEEIKVSSVTEIMNKFKHKSPLSNQEVSIHRGFSVNFSKPANAISAKFYLTLTYYEYDRIKYIIKKVRVESNLIRDLINTGVYEDNLSYIIKDNLYKQEIRRQILKSDSKDVVARYLGKATLEYFVLNRDYTDYVTYRMTSINAEVLTYSNIIGGFGLFGSRCYYKAEAMKIHPKSYLDFYQNMHDLKFAAPEAYYNLPDSLNDVKDGYNK